MLAAVTAGNKRPVGAQSDNHAPDAASHQILCADPGILVRLDRRSSDGFGFALVGNEIVEVFESSHLNRLRRRRIKNATDAIPAGKSDRVIDGLHRNFELQDNAIDRLQHFCGGIDVRRFDGIVCALYHQNSVLPARLNKNRGDTAG